MDQRVKKVIALIEEDLCRELPLEQLAKSVNLSTSRLRHLFSAEVGMSPMQYLQAVRMRKAKEMLETTFMSVKQIMCLIGVGGRNHFSNNFKKTYGMSPTRYRKLHFKPDGGRLLGP